MLVHWKERDYGFYVALGTTKVSTLEVALQVTREDPLTRKMSLWPCWSQQDFPQGGLRSIGSEYLLRIASSGYVQAERL